MPSQYDAIGSRFDMIKRTVLGKIEQHNFQKLVSPFLQRPETHVLDLACGTGFYMPLLLEWGAASVVGVDVSPVMLEAAASRLAGSPWANRVTLELGDALYMPGPVNNPHRPVREDDQPGQPGFEVVTCVWLLNYVKDKEELTGGFRSISMNLGPGGVLVALVPNPVEDVAAEARSVNAGGAGYPPSGVLMSYPAPPLDNGQGYPVVISVRPPESEPPGTQPWQVNTFHLRRSVWEEAARAGGMRGRLEWKMCEAPEGMVEESEEWQWWCRNPQMAVLVVYKE